MKIGLSYSRCVRDIVDGKVNIDDVLVLITRTNFDPHDDEQWTGIWEGYGGGQTFGSPFSNPEWMDYPAEDEHKFRSVSIELWESGKLHQPRKFGAHPNRRPEFWLETVLVSEEIETNPAVKAAWNNFQVVAGLTNTKLDKDYN
jgi:hypothetical protein